MAHRRGNRWIASWYERGVRKTKSCATRDLAEQVERHRRARELLVTMGLTSRREAEAASRSMRKPAEAIEQWAADMRARHLDGRYISEAKRAAARAMEPFGRLEEIDAAALTAWLDRQCTGVSPRTRNHYLGAARGVVRWCVVSGWLAVDPLAGLRRAPDHAVTRKRRALTPAEVGRLRSWSRYPDVLTCCLTGLRWTEARALTMADCDLGKGTLVKPKGVGKRDRGFHVALPLAGVLVDLLRQRPAVGRVPLVGPMPSSRDWQAACKRYGVEHRSSAGIATSASCRATFCTWLAESGVGLDTIMRLRRDVGPLAEARYVDRARLLAQMRAGVEQMARWWQRQAGVA